FESASSASRWSFPMLRMKAATSSSLPAACAASCWPIFTDARSGSSSTGGADAGSGADGEQKVLAPMPGRVVRVLVAEGDAVDLRQPLVVVEAMKMENELRSPKAGRVKHVSATAGLSVEAGAVLIVIE